MEYQRIIQLLVKQFSRHIDKEEQSELEQWRQQAGHRREWDQYHSVWEMTGRYKAGFQPDADKGWDRFQQRVQAARRRRKWATIGIVAAILTLLLLLLIFRKPTAKTAPPSAEPVALLTGPGEQRTVRLPDGSTVVLNENSRLSYLPGWKKPNPREVELSGEAFFNVTHRPGQPFLVHTAYTAVRVLGTAFNVRAYPAEPATEVAVEEGHVVLQAHRIGKELALDPMDKGICDENGAIFREENAGQNARAWQTGTLWFRKTPLREVARSLHHYFGVDLDLRQSKIADCKVNQSAFGEQEVFPTLQAMALSLGARVVQTGPRSYALLDGNCR